MRCERIGERLRAGIGRSSEFAGQVLGLFRPRWRFRISRPMCSGMPTKIEAFRRSSLFVLAVLALVLLFAAQAQAKKCDGKKVTIMGTAGPDHIVGKKASDVIYGGGGDDFITGGPNGNDTICGGPGDDKI